MRLIIIIMTSCLMQVSAASIAQKLTYSKQGVTLSQIFKEIKLQTGYNVFYSNEKIDKKRKIDVRFNNTDLKDVLDELAAKGGFEYTLDAKNISIKPKELSFLNRVLDAVTVNDIRGKVLDEKGNPLPRAVVKIKAAAVSYSTDKDGNFLIKNVAEDAVLQINVTS